MKPRRGLALASALAAVTLTLAACGQDVREVEPAHAPNMSLIAEGMGQSDINTSRYPAEILKLRGPKEVVTGSVEGVEQGRMIYMHLGAPKSEQDPGHFIVIRVRVDEVLLDKIPGAIDDGRVYVELFQGASYSDDNTPVHPLSEWQQAIPVGTKTMLFLYKSWWTTNAAATDNDGRGRPSGSTLLMADPEGMIFQFDGQLLSTGSEDAKGRYPWGMHSIDEVARDVKDYLAKTGG